MFRNGRPKGSSLLATLALVALLALAGCGGRVRTTGAPQSAGSNTNQVQTNQSSTGGAAASQVQSADQQVQSALSGLDSSDSDASTDFSSQDTSVTP